MAGGIERGRTQGAGERRGEAVSRRDLVGLGGGALALPLLGGRAGAQPLPDYRITDPEITLPTELPVRRGDTPVPSDQQLLFYIQHSQNRNTIVYAARPGADGPIDRNDPIDVFWRRFNRQGEREELTFFERFFVFGARCRADDADGRRFRTRLAAYADARGMLELDAEGRPRIVGRLGERDVQIVYAYAELGDRAFIPKINFVDVIGRDLVSGDYVTRHIKVGI